MTDDVIPFLHQQFENQRFRGESLKTLAFPLPPETGAYLTETGELLLAEVDAKRRILDVHEPYDSEETGAPRCWTCGPGEYTYPCTTVRALALPYADRPGYRSEWAPST